MIPEPPPQRLLIIDDPGKKEKNRDEGQNDYPPGLGFSVRRLHFEILLEGVVSGWNGLVVSEANLLNGL